LKPLLRLLKLLRPRLPKLRLLTPLLPRLLTLLPRLPTLLLPRLPSNRSGDSLVALPGNMATKKARLTAGFFLPLRTWCLFAGR